jgi:hypothetical protein
LNRSPDSELDSIRALIEMDHEYAKVAEYTDSNDILAPLTPFDSVADNSDDCLDQEMLDLDCFLNDVSLLSPTFATGAHDSLSLF